jgi:hypothetical protein
MNERLVIDTLKRCIGDLTVRGSIDSVLLYETLRQLEISYDRACINQSDTSKIEDLIKDIKYIKYELV